MGVSPPLLIAGVLGVALGVALLVTLRALLSERRRSSHLALLYDTTHADFDRLEQLQAELERMAYHDPLTGLANRARFTECATHALSRRDALVAALFIDLDDFKAVNDSLGHRAGDELLVAVTERLRGCLRAHDTPARLGGDEFAVLVEPVESMAVVTEIAERVLDALSETFAIADGEVRIGASIGVAASYGTDTGAEELLRSADLAMYRAKQQGKRCVAYYEERMHASAVERHTLRSELEGAVAADQLVVLFQPQVELRDGRIAGVEALVRWQHPRLGLVAPDRFIELAEEAGLMGDIGRSVLAASCERLALWRRASIAGDGFTLSLNLSPREFAAPALVASLADAATRAGVPTHAIVVEVTEAALADDLPAAIVRLDALRQAGFRVALDDFGTGAIPLGELRRLPADVLKVAKPFVDHVERPEDAAFLASLLDLARSLGLEVIVEGVETPGQARALLALGVERVQGYVFSRPVEDRALSALLTVAPLRGFAPATARLDGAGAVPA